MSENDIRNEAIDSSPDTLFVTLAYCNREILEQIVGLGERLIGWTIKMEARALLVDHYLSASVNPNAASKNHLARAQKNPRHIQVTSEQYAILEPLLNQSPNKPVNEEVQHDQPGESS